MNRFLMLILSLVLLAGFAVATPAQDARFSFTIAAKKSSYYLGEPIDLIYKITNNTDTSQPGCFELSSRLQNTQLLAKMATWDKFSPVNQLSDDAKSARRFVVPTDAIAPQDSRIYIERFITSDQNTPIFSAPGFFDLQVKSYIYTSFGRLELLSNVISVKVEELPSREFKAYKHWNDDLLLSFIDHKIRDEKKLREAIGRATKFIEDYPDSVYREYVQAGLLYYLRVNVSILSDEQKQLLTTLNHRPE